MTDKQSPLILVIIKYETFFLKLSFSGGTISKTVLTEEEAALATNVFKVFFNFISSVFVRFI